MANVMTNLTDATALNPHHWTSWLAQTVRGTTQSVLLTTTDTTALPAWFHELSTLLEFLRGLGLFTPTRSAVTSFLFPIAHAIRYARAG
eukprot:11499962-Ditylum_brightwellii.AAC.1